MDSIINFSLPIDVLRNKKLKASHLLIYGFLFSSRDEKNICYVTNQELANIFNYELRKIIRILNTLKEENLIIRDQSKRKEILINLNIVSNLTLNTVSDLSLNGVKNDTKNTVLVSDLALNNVNNDTKNQKGHIYINKDININNNINLDSNNIIKRATDVSRHRQFYQENSFCKEQKQEICQLDQADESSQDFQLVPLQEEPPKKKSSRFEVPTVEQVQQYMLGYCQASHKKYRELFLVNTKVEAVEFWEFYETKGWYVGKQKMKNWNMAASRWLRSTAEQIKLGRKQPRDLSSEEKYNYDTEQAFRNSTPIDVTEDYSGLDWNIFRKKTPEELEQERKEIEEMKEKIANGTIRPF